VLWPKEGVFKCSSCLQRRSGGPRDMTGMGHSRRFLRVPAASGYPPTLTVEAEGPDSRLWAIFGSGDTIHCTHLHLTLRSSMVIPIRPRERDVKRQGRPEI